MKYLFPLLFLLSSCASWHCRKCFENAIVKTDTTKTTASVVTPGHVSEGTVNLPPPAFEIDSAMHVVMNGEAYKLVKVDPFEEPPIPLIIPGDTVRVPMMATKYVPIYPRDTIYFDDGKVKLKLKFLKDGKLWLRSEVEPDTVEVPTSKIITNELKTGVPEARVWLIAGSLCVVALFLGVLIGKFLR